MVRSRQAARDAALSIVALGILVLVIVGVDARAREQIWMRIAPQHAAETVSAAGAQARSLTAVVVDALRDQALEHTPQSAFVLVALLLFVFMLRT
jgi:hypothetical protein